MPSGLCYQCGPKGSKLKSPKDIKKVRMFVVKIDDETSLNHIEYLCAKCARELGYA